MVYGETDPFNGAGRYDVLIESGDAGTLGIREGDAVVAYNRYGVFHGRAKFENIAKGNIELYWPEGNVVLPKGVYEPQAGIPEYNAAVVVEKAETYHALKDTRYVERRIEELELDLPG
jgi:anaerobic selenocysteine-containing dehydrogenase